MYCGKFEDIMPFDKREQDAYIDKLKQILSEGKEHSYTNFEICCLRTIRGMQQEIDAIPVFKGEKEPEEWLINLLQTDKDELIKWIGRCAWHCKKVDEQQQEIVQLKDALKNMIAISENLMNDVGVPSYENAVSSVKDLLETIDKTQKG